MEQQNLPGKRKLPKLMSCMTKMSLENLRSEQLFHLDPLDAKALRRRKYPLHECLILELQESGFTESSDYLRDLIYDNVQLLADDDIGIVVDLRQRNKYLEHVRAGLVKVEKYRDDDDKEKEAMELLKLALYYADKEKGIIWLAEKFFLGAIAVASQYLIDGGRQKNCCKYYYAKFLLDKFPGADLEEPFTILTEVRDSSIGKLDETHFHVWTLKDWPLCKGLDTINTEVPSDTVFSATALALHDVLLCKARMCRKIEPAQSETLARLAERRARDAGVKEKTADAIIEIGISQLLMNNLNNARKSFERALEIYKENNNIEGTCETWMHMSAVMQRLGNYEEAAKLLTDMGATAMENGLRRQLGRALHLLGELQLRRGRPNLGTQHLTEAFQCFMGVGWQNPAQISGVCENDLEKLDVILNTSAIEVYEEEAEQSRLMMAVSAGQELMASYFNLLAQAKSCAIDKVKVIEWKLSHAGWWNQSEHHEYIPCGCAAHNRTALDILRIRNKQADKLTRPYSEASSTLGRTDTIEDITKMKSSYIPK